MGVMQARVLSVGCLKARPMSVPAVFARMRGPVMSPGIDSTKYVLR